MYCTDISKSQAPGPGVWPRKRGAMDAHCVAKPYNVLRDGESNLLSLSANSAYVSSKAVHTLWHRHENVHAPAAPQTCKFERVRATSQPCSHSYLGTYFPSVTSSQTDCPYNHNTTSLNPAITTTERKGPHLNHP